MFSLLPLSDLAELVTRGISPLYSDIGIVVINQKCIRDNRIDPSASRYTDAEKTRIRPDKFVQVGDVLVNSTGTGTLGRVAQVKELSENTIVDSHVSIVRPDTKLVNARYFGYAMIYRQPYIETLGEGATNQTELSGTRLSQVTVPVPSSMKVQRKIASLLTTYDDLIDNNSHRIRILEQVTSDLYQEWFVQFRFPGNESIEFIQTEQGVLPRGWNRASLREICSYINRGIPPKYDDTAECIIVNQKCIRKGRLDLTLARRNAKVVPTEKYVKRGDILVNSTGEGTLGRVAQVYQDVINCTVDSHVSILRPANSIVADYLGITLIEMQDYLATLGEGATNQTELTRTRLGNIKVTVPSPEVTTQFSKTVEPLRTLASTLSKKNGLLREARDLLLPRLMSGELDVSELDINIPEPPAEYGA